MMLALLATAGCRSTQDSSQGGIAPTNEAFSITVPKSNTVKQGTNSMITVMINRGADFKRDVQLDIKTDGISITPSYVLVKASDKPEVNCQIAVGRDAAIGDYHVTVTGTPESGTPTSTIFTVTVAAQ
jgi:uncharacterized membrane protein